MSLYLESLRHPAAVKKARLSFFVRTVFPRQRKAYSEIPVVSLLDLWVRKDYEADFCVLFLPLFICSRLSSSVCISSAPPYLFFFTFKRLPKAAGHCSHAYFARRPFIGIPRKRILERCHFVDPITVKPLLIKFPPPPIRYASPLACMCSL